MFGDRSPLESQEVSSNTSLVQLFVIIGHELSF